MKTKIISLLVLLLLLVSSNVSAEEIVSVQLADTTKIITADSLTSQESDQIVIYYLHMKRRCATCEKLEAYSKEAVKAGFAEQLKDSTILLKIVNFEEEGNEHFANEYKLYSQSLVISKLQDGKEIKWKSLDKIWTLVNNKKEFITYVQTEVKDFMKLAEEK